MSFELRNHFLKTYFFFINSLFEGFFDPIRCGRILSIYTLSFILLFLFIISRFFFQPAFVTRSDGFCCWLLVLLVVGGRGKNLSAFQNPGQEYDRCCGYSFMRRICLKTNRNRREREIGISLNPMISQGNIAFLLYQQEHFDDDGGSKWAPSLFFREERTIDGGRSGVCPLSIDLREALTLKPSCTPFA